MDIEEVKSARDFGVMFVVYIIIGFALAIGFGAARWMLGLIF